MKSTQLRNQPHNHQILLVKTRKRETFARKTKINVARKAFGRNVGTLATNVKIVKTRKREASARKTKRTVARRMLKANARRLVGFANFLFDYSKALNISNYVISNFLVSILIYISIH